MRVIKIINLEEGSVAGAFSQWKVGALGIYGARSGLGALQVQTGSEQTIPCLK